MGPFYSCARDRLCDTLMISILPLTKCKKATLSCSCTAR
jgi:hypothetical protein